MMQDQGLSPGVRRALGLMSGTSMDGVDVALLETDGRDRVRAGATGFLPYDEADRATLRAALGAARQLLDRTARPAALAEAERIVTRRHAEAVEAFLGQQSLDARDLDVIGFHGQTVLHRPDIGLTIQIGDGAGLARRLGVPVVADLRAADMVAGGQGAPLVPVYHRALAQAAAIDGSLLVINIGGVTNITYLPAGGGEPIACDTGPGNALIDDLMRERTGAAFDGDGAAAARGRVDATALGALMAHPYFAAPLPKSLDRDAFSRAPVAGLSTEDAAATLTAFTAASLAAIVPLLPAVPRRAIVCGGGGRNPALMAALRDRLGIAVAPAADFGWDGDAIEAQAFAYLAVRSLAGLPLTFPGTTGCRAPATGGVRHEP